MQSTQTLSEAFQLRQPIPFRSRAQRAGRLVPGLRLQGLTEQAGLGQHAFALQVVGLLVVLVPGVQLTGGERVALQGGEQRLCLLAVVHMEQGGVRPALRQLEVVVELLVKAGAGAEPSLLAPE